MMATLRDVRKVPFRVVATLPETFGDGRTGTGRGWHDRQSLPIVDANLHVGVITPGLIAIVPDGPRLRLAGFVASNRGGLGWGRARIRVGAGGIGGWSPRPGWVGETYDDTAIATPAATTASLAPASPPMAPAMPVCLGRIVRRRNARDRVTHWGSSSSIQQECHYCCGGCTLAHSYASLTGLVGRLQYIQTIRTFSSRPSKVSVCDPV